MASIEIVFGLLFGLTAYIIFRSLALGFYTVAPNERAVITSFGRAQRLKGSTLETPLADDLSDTDRERYVFPQIQVIPPGGPYFRWPWQKVHKVNIAIATASIAYDPETPMPTKAGWCSRPSRRISSISA